MEGGRKGCEGDAAIHSEQLIRESGHSKGWSDPRAATRKGPRAAPVCGVCDRVTNNTRTAEYTLLAGT